MYNGNLTSMIQELDTSTMTIKSNNFASEKGPIIKIHSSRRLDFKGGSTCFSTSREWELVGPNVNKNILSPYTVSKAESKTVISPVL